MGRCGRALLGKRAKGNRCLERVIAFLLGRDPYESTRRRVCVSDMLCCYEENPVRSRESGLEEEMGSRKGHGHSATPYHWKSSDSMSRAHWLALDRAEGADLRSAVLCCAWVGLVWDGYELCTPYVVRDQRSGIWISVNFSSGLLPLVRSTGPSGAVGRYVCMYVWAHSLPLSCARDTPYFASTPTQIRNVSMTKTDCRGRG